MNRLDQFERLALPHMTAAHTLAYWLMRNRSDAEDVVQDAYLRAFRGFSGFRGGDFRVWLLTIVRNAAFRAMSDRSRQSNVFPLRDALPAVDPVEDMASADPSPEDQLIAKNDQALVLRALEELPPLNREALVLREVEGLTYKDIATVTGVPVGTVMSRLARGREQLRAKLETQAEKDRRHGL